MKFPVIAAFLMVAGLCIAGPASAEEIDFSKAVVIGSGPKKIVEFTDPDCPYCRHAAKYFEGRTDLTRYIFFNPLPSHPKSKEKVQYILSQTDKVKYYHDFMSGKMDGMQKFEGITPKGVQLQEEQHAIAKKAKVNATPTFIVNGRVFVGLNQQKIEEALGTKK